MAHGSQWRVCAAAVVGVVGLVAAPASAQSSSPDTSSPAAAHPPSSDGSNDKVSHWGVGFSVSPSWQLPKKLTDTFASDGGSLAVEGSQFTIGLVHGRTTSGDWGVRFVHQPIKNGSRGSDSDSECGFANGPLNGGCFNTSGGAVTQNVAMNGVEVYKFLPFVLIKRHVQIGIEFGGGVGKLSGTLQKTSSDVTNIQVNPKNGSRTGVLTTTVTTEAVTEEVPGTLPIGRLSLVAAVILHPAIKVRWEGGMVFPGESFSTVVVTYLIGAH